MTQHIDYALEQDHVQPDVSVGFYVGPSRWPCTRTNAKRQCVLRTLAASDPGKKAYQWIRVLEIGSPLFT